MSAFNRDITNKPEYTLGATSFRGNVEVKLLNVFTDANNIPTSVTFAEVVMGTVQHGRTAKVSKNNLGYKFNYLGTTFYLKEFN